MLFKRLIFGIGDYEKINEKFTISSQLVIKQYFWKNVLQKIRFIYLDLKNT